MELEEQKGNHKEFKWSANYINPILKNNIKKHNISIRLLKQNEVNNEQ